MGMGDFMVYAVWFEFVCRTWFWSKKGRGDITAARLHAVLGCKWHVPPFFFFFICVISFVLFVSAGAEMVCIVPFLPFACDVAPMIDYVGLVLGLRSACVRPAFVPLSTDIEQSFNEGMRVAAPTNAEDG